MAEIPVNPTGAKVYCVKCYVLSGMKDKNYLDRRPDDTATCKECGEEYYRLSEARGFAD